MRREDDLRAAMQVLAVDPPTVEDVIGVVRPWGERRRRRTWILPVAAATVTLAVVLTVTALVSSGHSAQQSPPVRRPAPSVAALVGVHWRLLTVQKDGAAPTHGDAPLFIRKDGKFTVTFRCGLWQGVVRPTDRGAEFIDGAYVGFDCPYVPTNLDVDSRAVESVLSGPAQWSLRDRRLIIAKPGVGALTYSPSEVSATIRGRLVAVGGPPGPARPLIGTVTVSTNGGQPRTVTVGSDGNYSVTVAPGTYQVQGHSPLYQSGKWPCRAQEPADASAGTTTTVNVYCQEK
jgi:hypothetical protein